VQPVEGVIVLENLVRIIVVTLGSLIVSAFALFLVLALFFSGPTGEYHVSTANGNGRGLVASVYQDRKFYPDNEIYRGTPENAIRLYMSLTTQSKAHSTVTADL
jgi:hypothetical protein